MALAIVSLCALCQFDHNEKQDAFIGYVTLLALAFCDGDGVINRVPLHLLGQDNQNEAQHDFYSHIIPLVPASASHDADRVVNGTIAFVWL